MEYRTLGKTGYDISSIGFGAWAIGGTWGEVNDAQSLGALHRALDLGVNFFDTADVYGDGHSERLLRRLRQERQEPFLIATKAGRRLDPHVAGGYNRENLRAFVERSLDNLGAETLDLLQLHCPPSEVYGQDEVFGVLDDFVREGLLRAYGVSVETVSEALTAIRHPGVATVQMIFNAFRLKPAEDFFAAAREADVGIIARVPLASGLLTGKLRRETSFAPDDHRAFNRHGEAFDRGETFSGVEYETGLEAAQQLQELVPPGMTLAGFALRWILMFPEVSCAIPGARTPQQAESNAAAADLPPLDEAQMQAVQDVYDRLIRAQVHPLW
ncbi:aldo/keto reductase [Deinococcus hopiensis]|uniref:Predicted oxidoreductase n=1 Tax=Deinococcus hopiensis KR-140 TaxID=695939 RepID=A0A1W1UP02_9DEIO|nr:aldo/keto reductase [Deinococcus hopiensis]SMB82729.1 Predicted oxidoreductase [Deinococcus hopiensis KR-140]